MLSYSQIFDLKSCTDNIIMPFFFILSTFKKIENKIQETLLKYNNYFRKRRQKRYMIQQKKNHNLHPLHFL